MPNLAFNFQIKSLTEAGEFTGLASVYDVVDLQGDVVSKGAFAKTLSGSKQRPLLLEHRDTIGTVTLADSDAGLMAKGKLTLAVQKAAEAYALLKDNALGGMSIGYEAVNADYQGDHRILKEIRLWECSLVTFPACPGATVSSIKSSAQQTSIIAALDRLQERVLRGLRGE